MLLQFRSLGVIIAPALRPPKKKLHRIGDPIPRPTLPVQSMSAHHSQATTTATHCETRASTPASFHHSSRPPPSPPLHASSGGHSSVAPHPGSRASSLSLHSLASEDAQPYCRQHLTLPDSSQSPAVLAEETTHNSSASNGANGRHSARSRLRSPSTHDEPADKRQRRSHSPTQRRFDTIAYKNGKTPAGSRPRQSDYEKWIQSIIAKAISSYNLKLVTVNAFPSAEQDRIWAREAWGSACEDHKKCFSEEDSLPILTLVRSLFTVSCTTD